LPKNAVDHSVAYEHFPKQDVDRIIGNIGVKRHREAAPGTTTSDLCIPAAEALLEKLGWSRDSVDGLLFVSQTPDYLFPATSHRIQHALGLPDKTLCLDVNLGCSGFTHGVIVANSLISSGLSKRLLLFCGDVTTGTIRPGSADARTHGDLGNALMFGDAGAVAAFDAEGPTQYRGASWGSDGSGMGLINVPGGGFREFCSPALFETRLDESGQPRRAIDLRINGAAIFNFTIRRVPPLIDDVLAKSGWNRDEVDAYVFHQANKFILEFLRKKVKIPAEKVPLSIEEFGNTSSASVPITMSTQLGELLGRGGKVMILGFGSGLSWSGVGLDVKDVTVLPLMEL
jgi:3-oxoacyl-[acyl-carrier-protein] synthase-3